MPGSNPQGTIFGVILFLLYVNRIAFPSEITLQGGEVLNQYWISLNIHDFTLENQDKTLRGGIQAVKFHDDITVQEVIPCQQH